MCLSEKNDLETKYNLFINEEKKKKPSKKKKNFFKKAKQINKNTEQISRQYLINTTCPIIVGRFAYRFYTQNVTIIMGQR